MEILNQRNIIGRTIVREKFTIYERVLYSDKTVEWNPISYDGECDEEELEKKFQDLINKPVETTKEQPLTNEEIDFLIQGLSPDRFLQQRLIVEKLKRLMV